MSSRLNDRQFVNKTIATAVVFHLVSVMMAARFDAFWLTRIAVISGASLSIILGPLFWLWHRATKPRRSRHQAFSDDRTKNLRYIAMMLDELKYLLSPPTLQALGTVRDKSCHIMLAHQSNGDLEDCGGLDPNAVKGAVLVNTGLKLVYRATDPDTLKWASELSGSIVIQQQSAHMQQGMFHAAEGQFRETERPWITPNEILAMPKLCGMFFGFGLARRIHVDTLTAGKRPQLTPANQVSPALKLRIPPAPTAPEKQENHQPISQSSASNVEPDKEQKQQSRPTNPDPMPNLY